MNAQVNKDLVLPNTLDAIALCQSAEAVLELINRILREVTSGGGAASIARDLVPCRIDSTDELTAWMKLLRERADRITQSTDYDGMVHRDVTLLLRLEKFGGEALRKVRLLRRLPG
jgi:hypothetical protein